MERRVQILDDMKAVGSSAGSGFTRDDEMEDLYQAWLKAGRPANVYMTFDLENDRPTIVAYQNRAEGS